MLSKIWSIQLNILVAFNQFQVFIQFNQKIWLRPWINQTTRSNSCKIPCKITYWIYKISFWKFRKYEWIKYFVNSTKWFFSVNNIFSESTSDRSFTLYTFENIFRQKGQWQHNICTKGVNGGELNEYTYILCRYPLYGWLIQFILHARKLFHNLITSCR